MEDKFRWTMHCAGQWIGFVKIITLKDLGKGTTSVVP